MFEMCMCANNRAVITKCSALRILEVRSAYCKHDFEWDNLKRLACKMVEESNTGLMRDFVLETSHVEGEN